MKPKRNNPDQSVDISTKRMQTRSFTQIGLEEKQIPLQKEFILVAVEPCELTRIFSPQTGWKPIGGRLLVP